MIEQPEERRGEEHDDDLEVNPQTVRDLTPGDEETEQLKGGAIATAAGCGGASR